MIASKPTVIAPGDAFWPQRLTERMGRSAPRELHTIGPGALLESRQTALFCSARTPGAAILRAHDAARRMRDEGVTVISGFLSPIEVECLRILLRGKQPIIICPARAVEAMRIPSICRAAFGAGRVLFVSPSSAKPKRVTRTSALRRNEVVTVLADDAYIAHVTAGGQAAHIRELLTRWGISVDPSAQP